MELLPFALPLIAHFLFIHPFLNSIVPSTLFHVFVHFHLSHSQMPRLNLQHSSSNLTWALSNLGLGDLFKPGFSQLHGISEYKWLAVSDIISKTYLEIKDNSMNHPFSMTDSIGTSNGANSLPTTPSPPNADGHNINKHHQYSQQKPMSPVTSVTNVPHSGQQMIHLSHGQTQYQQQQQQQQLLLLQQQQHQQQLELQYQKQQAANTNQNMFDPHQHINLVSHPFLSLNHNRIKYPIYGFGHPNRQKQPTKNWMKKRGDIDDTIDVTFNKPFIYFVIDTVSGLIMAMGKVGREPVNYRLPI